MPVGDLVLSELPAEKRVLVADPRREVDEPGVRVLHERAERVDAVDATGDTRELGRSSSFEVGEPLRVDAAAVAGDAQRQLAALGLSGREIATVDDEPLGQRPHLRERGVRLGEGEGCGLHARIIERTVASGQRAAQDDWRLAGWLGFVALFAALAYSADDTTLEGMEEPLYEASFFVASAVGLGLMVGAALLVALRAPKRAVFALWRPRSWWRAVGISFLILVGMLALAGALSPYIDPGEEQGLLPEAWPPPDAAVFALNAVAVVVLAPFAEEFLFRGIGYSLFERFGTVAAVVAPAVGWALAHGLVEGFPVIFAFGIGLALLRRASGSIVPCMLLHAIFNTLALAAAAASASSG